MAQAFNEDVSRSLIPLAQCKVENQFGMPLDCDEGVSVPKVLIVFWTDALLLFPDVGPKFVTFDVAYRDIPNLDRP